MHISCRSITSSQHILGLLFKKGVKENQKKISLMHGMKIVIVASVAKSIFVFTIEKVKRLTSSHGRFNFRKCVTGVY